MGERSLAARFLHYPAVHTALLRLSLQDLNRLPQRVMDTARTPHHSKPMTGTRLKCRWRPIFFAPVSMAVSVFLPGRPIPMARVQDLARSPFMPGAPARFGSKTFVTRISVDTNCRSRKFRV